MMMMMMVSSNVEGSLKEALYETLDGILSPHRDTRQAAEQRIQALEVTDDFGIHLTEFVVDPNVSLSIRQLASVLLKQYVESHWSSTSEKFRPPEIKHETKERIKELLPLGLRESISKIRASVAYAISAIAHWDWPENWPGLFDILVSCLSGHSEFAVHGAMRVLTEFTRDLTDSQLPNVGPVILEEMYRIFQSENEYSMRTRGRAVEIFSTIATLVASAGLYQKGFVQQYLEPVIPLYMEKFVQFLRITNGPSSDSGLKTDIIKAINCLMNQLTKYVAIFVPQILPTVWHTMTQSAKIYQDGTVNGDVDINDKDVDSDGEIINFNNLIIATFEFIHTLIDHSASDDKRFSGLLDNLVQEAMYYLIIFMQITEQQIILWTNDPSQFIEEDDLQGYNYNVRISAQELLNALVDHHSDVTSVNALCEVITRHIAETNRQRIVTTAVAGAASATAGAAATATAAATTTTTNNTTTTTTNTANTTTATTTITTTTTSSTSTTTTSSSSRRSSNSTTITAVTAGTISTAIPSSGIIEAANSWKIYESSILALCIIKDQIMDMHQGGTLHFDIVGFLDSVVLATLNNSGAHPFLLGRCLCVGGRYAPKLPPEMSCRFLEATVNGLLENQPVCIRISAVKAVYWFCEASNTENPAIQSIMRNHLPAIFEGLFSLASSQPTTQILTLVMETFAILVTIDKSFTARIESKICPFTIAVFIKFHSDPQILDLCQHIFKALTENPQCIGPLQTRIVPTLISMMAVNPMDKTKDEGTRGVALDVLQVLVQYSPRPLSSSLVENAFPAACHCILNSEENGTLQNGGEVIRTYLSVAARQVTDNRDSEGCTGLQFILQIVAQLLNPRSSEFTATFVGKLVITLIRKVGSSLGGDLDLLLKAVLSKMQQVETLTVMQSLLMIYAHLINTEFDAVLNFLSTVPGPTGESALAFVLGQWVSRQHLFFGRYDRKVTTVALSKILEYGVTNDDSRLNEITVRGEEIFTANNTGMRTRSKALTQPYQWTSIPVLVKIFKLILNELSCDMEAVDANQDSETSGADEDDDDEGVGGGGGGGDSGNDSIVDPGDGADLLRIADEDDEKEQDPDLLQDSIYHLNLSQYLGDFLKNFSSHHCFPAFVEHLTAQEGKVLANFNINVTYA